MKKHLKFLILFVCLLLPAARFADAQNAPVDFLKRQVTVGAETYGYRVYLPPNYKPNKKLPVMLFLHGSGANGTDNERQIRGADRVIAQNPQFFDFIIVFPQARPNTFWLGASLAQAFAALDQSVKEFTGDPKRLYLSGFSLGAYGTWTGAVLSPNKFAAYVPVSGGIVPPVPLPKPIRQSLPNALAAILDAADPYAALAESLGNTPVWMTHGSADETVPVMESRKISEALKNKGAKNIVYTEFPATNHNDAFLKTFTDPALYKWLAARKL